MWPRGTPSALGSEAAELVSRGFLFLSTQPQSPVNSLNTRSFLSGRGGAAEKPAKLGTFSQPVSGLIKPAKPELLPVKRRASSSRVLDISSIVMEGESR